MGTMIETTPNRRRQNEEEQNCQSPPNPLSHPAKADGDDDVVPSLPKTLSRTHNDNSSSSSSSSSRKSCVLVPYLLLSATVLLVRTDAFAPSHTNPARSRLLVTTRRQAEPILLDVRSSSSARRISKNDLPRTAAASSRTLLAASKSEETPAPTTTTTTTNESSGGMAGLVDPATALTAAVTGNPPFSVTLDDGSIHSYTEAIQRTLGWVGAAIVFGGGLWAVAGAQTGEEFFAGYLVEQSLSVDNLFVFLLLFEYFKVPLQYQDRVLNWGIYGAIVMRAVMIGIGAAALQQFHAILLVFAGILVYSSAKFFVGAGDEEDEDPSDNAIVKFSHSLIKSTEHYDGDRFFTVVDGIRKATPLFICMIAVEVSDVVFAVDSIPAVFGITEVRRNGLRFSLVCRFRVQRCRCGYGM